MPNPSHQLLPLRPISRKVLASILGVSYSTLIRRIVTADIHPPPRQLLTPEYQVAIIRLFGCLHLLEEKDD